MDKVAELLKPFPYRTDTVTRDTEAFFKRQDLIKSKLKSGELTPEDIKIYNENDNPTNLYFCYTCDNISELVRPNFYKVIKLFVMSVKLFSSFEYPVH